MKTLAYRFRADGRKRRFSNMMMSFIIQRMPCKACNRISFVFPSFQRFHVDGRKRFNYATCGRVPCPDTVSFCRYQKALYFWSLGISLYLELFCFPSFISFVLRNLCSGTHRRNPDTSVIYSNPRWKNNSFAHYTTK